MYKHYTNKSSNILSGSNKHDSPKTDRDPGNRQTSKPFSPMGSHLRTAAENTSPPHSPTLDLFDKLSVNKSNPNYLTVLDRNSSGKSGARSRVSEQRSFESYDSSISAQSWPSSTEPDWTSSQSQYGSGNRRSEPISDSSNGPMPSRRSKPATSAFPHAPHESQKIGYSHQNNTPMEEDNSSLKIINSGRELSVGEKTQNAAAGQGSTSMWKRAFQSLRKDKQQKRDKSVPEHRERQTTSGEVDPVYHLLRCAATKSQATVAGISAPGGSSRTGGEKQRATTSLDGPLAKSNTKKSERDKHTRRKT